MRRRGVTLVELLVAMALAIMIVGLVASIATQVNRTVSTSTVREDASRMARVIFSDIDRDLSGLLPLADPPDPFVEPVLRLVRGDGADGARSDQLVLLTTIRDPTTSGQRGTIRAYVTYALGDFHPLPGGGPDVASLDRSFDVPGVTGLRPVRIDANVVSLKFEWLDGQAVFQDPNAATAETAVSPFGFTGKVQVGTTLAGETEVSAADEGGKEVLRRVALGDELKLVGDEVPGNPRRTLVRKRSSVDVDDPRVLVTDRLDPTSGDVTAALFQPPTQLRCTLVLAFGRGPDQGTATFSRSFTVPK